MCKTGRAYAYRTRVRVRTTSAGRLGVLIWNEMKGYLYINISKGYRCIEGIYIYIDGAIWYLRPVSGCIRPWCVLGVTFALAGCFGLLTFVLLLANSSRMVCGMSGSNRTPCCRNQTHNKIQCYHPVFGNRRGLLCPRGVYTNVNYNNNDNNNNNAGLGAVLDIFR